MKLIELLSVIDEYETVKVYKKGWTVGMYDGKDAIDEEYNDCKVEKVQTCENKNVIVINLL